MTRLVGQGDTPQERAASEERRFAFEKPGDRAFGDGRERARTLDLDDKKRGLDARIAGGGTEERSDAFRAALKRHEEGRDASPASEAAMLAAVQAGRTAEPQIAAEPEAPARPAVAARVLAVAEACERAVRAELYLQMGKPVSVDLTVGDLMPGLDRLKVSLDATTLEVAFVRAAPPVGSVPVGGAMVGSVAGATAAAAVDPAAATVEAAQALAEQLRARFPRRTVRVVEIEAAAETAAPRSAPSGAASLSDLFRQGGAA